MIYDLIQGATGLEAGTEHAFEEKRAFVIKYRSKIINVSGYTKIKSRLSLLGVLVNIFRNII